MDQLIAEIEAFCAATGASPQSVLRRACGYGWDKWAAWKAGRSSPTLVNADRLRAWMDANRPAPTDAPTPTSDAA